MINNNVTGGYKSEEAESDMPWWNWLHDDESNHNQKLQAECLPQEVSIDLI